MKVGIRNNFMEETDMPALDALLLGMEKERMKIEKSGGPTAEEVFEMMKDKMKAQWLFFTFHDNRNSLLG